MSCEKCNTMAQDIVQLKHRLAQLERIVETRTTVVSGLDNPTIKPEPPREGEIRC